MPWLGWRNSRGTGILDYFDKCRSNEQAKYLATLFLTGCRVSEALELKPDSFRWNEHGIVGYNCRVLKHYDYEKNLDGEKITSEVKGRKWQTQPRSVYRNVFIKRVNELDDYFVELLESCDTEYLLPAMTKRGHHPLAEPASRAYAYTMINSIDDKLWPHFLRAQCCSYLIEELRLDAYAIKRWFEWSSLEMSDQYFKRSGIEIGRIMGVPEWPQPS
jgi:integrase